MAHDFYEAEEDILTVVNAFEKRRIPSSKWNHTSRLTVTIWYLLTLDEAEASTRLISSLRALDRSHKLSNDSCQDYNETTTMFWIVVARSFLYSTRREVSRLEKVNRFLRAYACLEALVYEYYSPATLHSWRARSRWVEPDVRPLIQAGSSPSQVDARCGNMSG